MRCFRSLLEIPWDSDACGEWLTAHCFSLIRKSDFILAHEGGGHVTWPRRSLDASGPYPHQDCAPIAKSYIPHGGGQFNKPENKIPPSCLGAQGKMFASGLVRCKCLMECTLRGILTLSYGHFEMLWFHWTPSQHGMRALDQIGIDWLIFRFFFRALPR